MFPSIYEFFFFLYFMPLVFVLVLLIGLLVPFCVPFFSSSLSPVFVFCRCVKLIWLHITYFITVFLFILFVDFDSNTPALPRISWCVDVKLFFLTIEIIL